LLDIFLTSPYQHYVSTPPSAEVNLILTVPAGETVFYIGTCIDYDFGTCSNPFYPEQYRFSTRFR
jgi:hypothetical protein